MSYRTILLAAVLGCTSMARSAFGEGALEGTVSGANHKPLSQAVIFVYSARLKQGYATVCPTCWVDCGKSVISDERGHFLLQGLQEKLKFRLLIVKGGYTAGEIRGADPSSGVSIPIELTPRPASSTSSTLLKGRITDVNGFPVAGALIEPTGEVKSGGMAIYGKPPGWESLTVSAPDGGFELFSLGPYETVALMISPRSHAPKLSIESMGKSDHVIRVAAGATVMGRLTRGDGTVIANAELALSPLNSMNGEEFRPERVGTDARGRFAFSNVPAHHVWRVYPTESLEPLNLMAKPRWCEVRADGETVDIGSYVMTAGLTLGGEVKASGGWGLTPGMTVALDDAFAGGNNRVAEVSADGKFVFRNLPPGPYTLTAANRDRVQSVSLEILLERDRDDLRLALPE